MRDEVVITREEYLNYLARKNFNLESSKLAIEVMFVTWARENTFAELSAQQNDFHELLRSYSRSGGRLRELYWRLGDIFPFGPINSIEKKVGLERLAFNLSGYSINPMDVNFNEKKRDLRFAESFLALIEASPVEAAAWNGFSHVILSNLAKSALFFERNSHSFEVGVHMRAVDHLENIVSQVQSLQEGVEPFLKSHAGILRLVQEKEGGLESRSAQLQYRELHLFRAFELEAEKSIKQEGRLGFQLYVFEKWRQHPLVNEYVSAYFINHPEDISDRELSIAVMQERPVGKNDLLFTLMQEEFLRRMPKLLGKFLERYPNYEHPAGGGI